MKNLHFWTDFDVTLRVECTNELLHLPNLQQNRTKIVDFLLMVKNSHFSGQNGRRAAQSTNPDA